MSTLSNILLNQDFGREVGQGSDRVTPWLGLLAGEALRKGAETVERGVAEGQTQKILNGMPMLYTVPYNSLGSVGVAMES